MRKKLLSCLLTMCMLFTLLPTAAFAAGANPFTDVKDADWFYDEVLWVEDEGLMNGTTATTFAPNAPTTRGMLVTILWRLAGKPDAKGEQFDDVDDGAYYADATVWGCANDIICGYGDGNFGPNDAITRQQMATILYRYAKWAKYDVTEKADLSDYADADEVASWAENAMAWANAEGLINGMTEDTLVPAGNATRAQVAAILYRMTGLSPAEDDKPSSSGGSSSGGHTHKWGEWTSNGDGTHTRVCTKNESHTQKANCTVGAPVFEDGKFVYTCEECGEFTSDALLVYDAGDMDLIQTYLTGDLTVEFMDDIDMSGETWTPITVNGAASAGVLTINGNDKTITGLDNMLIDSTWAGKSGVVINDLTLSKANIVVDAEDAAETKGVGAFIGWPQASETVTLNNCHLVDSHVEGGHWTGGLIGIAAGYSGNDGPVFETVTITDCSVKDSTITGKGSVGGIIGHATASAWTEVVIEDCQVSGNTITSTGDAVNKAGSVLATVGAAGLPTTADGETRTGGTWVNNTTVEDNTVTSNSTAIETIYGRQGTPGGMLYIDGVAVDFGDTVYAAYVNSTGYETLEAAAQAATAGQTITLMDDVALTGNAVLAAGVILDGNNKTVDASGIAVNSDCAITTHGGTVKNLTITGGKDKTRAIGSGSTGTYSLSETLYIDHVTIDNVMYAINGGGVPAAKVVVTNSTINGWSSFSGIDSLEFTNCKLGMGGSYDGYMPIYGDTAFTDCTFEEFSLCGRDGFAGTVTFTGCTYAGEEVTAANFKSLFMEEGDEVDFAKLNNFYVIVDGLYYAADGAHLKSLIEDFDEGTEATIALGEGEYTTTEAISVGGGKNITIQGVEGTRLTTWFKITADLKLQDLTLVSPDTAVPGETTSQYTRSTISLMNEGDVVCENVTFDMGTAVDDATAITAWWSTGEGANITVTGCEFLCAGNRPIRSDACVTVENCTFYNPYRYAVQLTSKASTATGIENAVVNFNNNTIVGGDASDKPVYGIQLEGEVYGCGNLIINGEGNEIVETTRDTAMYYCECGKVEHATIVWNTEAEPVHAVDYVAAILGGDLYVTLQEAVDAAGDGDAVTLLKDITEDVTITQKADVQFTIDGKDNTFSGVMLVDGKSSRYETAGLTIQNVNFNAETLSADAFIRLGNGESATRYTNNVTVKDCTFSGSDIVAVKSYTGGDLNLTIDGCTVNEGMHSMLQVANVEKGLKIVDCKVYSKNGANLNNTLSLEMSGCTFDVIGYAVRFGVSGSVNAEEKTFAIENSTLKSACDDGDAVIIFRDSAAYATLALTSTTLEGTTQFKGNTDTTTIIIDGKIPVAEGFVQDPESGEYEITSAAGMV